MFNANKIGLNFWKKRKLIALFTKPNFFLSGRSFDADSSRSFFFFRQILTFQLVVFDSFSISFKKHCYPELKIKKIIHLWSFLLSYGGLKIANLANLGHLTRDIFLATNALAEILTVLEIVPNWMKEAYLT